MPLKAVGLLPIAAAIGALVASKGWLRLAPGRAVRWSTRVADTPRIIESPALPDAIVRAVRGVAPRWPFRATCLEQSIALVMLLTVARIRARVIIGVDRSAAGLTAHAWVESDGRILLGGAHAKGFTPLTSASCRA